MVPAVGRILTHPLVRPVVARVGHEMGARLVREAIERWPLDAPSSKSKTAILEAVSRSVVEREQELRRPSLRRVLNGTGIVVHTNLGRAPLGETAARHLAAVAQGYTNLELDLDSGKRGNRQCHLRDILCLLTGAEDVLVVNNNAAALLLVLRALAFRREVVVSRGELIEIGDSFRLPDILSMSGARLVEVGSTNRTHLADYQGAIGPRTALLLKAHTSNYRTIGFCASVGVRELADLARARGVPCVYDLGSGMLQRPSGVPLGDEPSVAESLAAGADLITCSGDKLLGGAQAGLIAGRGDLVAQLAQIPLLRALRPGRLTLAALDVVARQHLDGSRLRDENPAFRMLARSPEELRESAEHLMGLLRTLGVEAEIVQSQGQVGGGALPGVLLPGWAVKLGGLRRSRGAGSPSAVALALLRGDPPLLAVLREGELVIDVRTLQDEELVLVAKAIHAVLGDAEVDRGS
jgi:L-seryl-tRNA(Ser) seleniumtransferase